MTFILFGCLNFHIVLLQIPERLSLYILAGATRQAVIPSQSMYLPIYVCPQFFAVTAARQPTAV